MRTEFQADLAELSALLVAMADEVRAAMRRATEALLQADDGLAHGVITGDAAVNELHHEVEEKVYGVLARQAPVASDLRLVVSALHIAADFERMGDLAKHVAKTALRRHPARAVPEELIPVIRDMADVADRISGKISRVLAHPDAGLAAQLETDDDAMDELHKGLFVVLLGAAWRHGVESAIDGALLGRFYERFADHAVNAGHRMIFLVTGEQR
ncbi:MAG TPA: phosphate signaling complex protein PhoU [Micromonosporaceae bacterium]